MEDTTDMDMIMDMVDLTQFQQELNTHTKVDSVMTPMSNTQLPTTNTTQHHMAIQSMVMDMVMVVMDITKLN